jgi:hypothetical protein
VHLLHQNEAGWVLDGMAMSGVLLGDSGFQPSLE